MGIAESSPAANEPAWVADVLRYWFGELEAKFWFAKNDDVDRTISERFSALHEQLLRDPGAGAATPRGLLATVIVLDQFSRNMFRGTPRAFAADSRALELAKRAVEQKLDESMSRTERLFLYLPFEHSEDCADQARSVDLIAQLGDSLWTEYALAHKSIIDRFGRFPHRNAILGRTSSAEELALLEDPKGSF